MTLCLIGYPFTGKTTFAKGLVAKYPKLNYFSTGECVRDLGVVKEDEKDFEQYDLSLRLNSIIIKRVEDELFFYANNVLDGYPRSLEQCEHLAVKASTPVMIRYFSINPLIIYERLMNSDRHRVEDTPEAVAGRIKAALKFKKVVQDQSIVHGWDFVEWDSEQIGLYQTGSYYEYLSQYF
jgi:adenylate kinase family enzyme